jgi:uncharacterized Fe-S cluster-containing protein
MCADSDEIKMLQDKIKAAYLNKERTSQLAEAQFRKIQDIEEEAMMEAELLRQKELNDREERSKAMMGQAQRFEHKQVRRTVTPELG